MARQNIRSAVRQRIATVDKQFRKEVTAEMRVLGHDVEREYKKFTADWEHKIQFKSQVTIGSDFVQLTNKPAGRNKQIFHYVDKGTDGPYIIQPRDPNGYLTFQTGHNAKTAPGAKYKQGDGGRTGGWVKTKQVIHPGIAAREFSKKVHETILPAFRRAIENAFRRAARR